jgi:hypothetical protein
MSFQVGDRGRVRIHQSRNEEEDFLNELIQIVNESNDSRNETIATLEEVATEIEDVLSTDKILSVAGGAVVALGRLSLIILNTVSLRHFYTLFKAPWRT